MIKPSLVALAAIIILMLGCASSPYHLMEWMHYVENINTINPTQLTTVRDIALEDHHRQPNDESRLRLAYVVSRANVATQDLTKSRLLLAQIAPDSAYVPLRDMVLREIQLTAKLEETRQTISALQTQLESLKAIETELKENQHDLDEAAQ